MLTAEVAQCIDDSVVMNVVLINEQSYPAAWDYDDSKEYYRQMLRKPKNITILLKDDEKDVGFLLAIPHDDAVEELERDDPHMVYDPAIYYIENVAILPAYRSKDGFTKMLDILRSELKKREISKISMHARVSNNLSKNIQDNMNVMEKRRINAWKYYNFEETTDYIVAAWPFEPAEDNT